jgi:hypothetical protein
MRITFTLAVYSIVCLFTSNAQTINQVTMGKSIQDNLGYEMELGLYSKDSVVLYGITGVHIVYVSELGKVNRMDFESTDYDFDVSAIVLDQFVADLESTYGITLDEEEGIENERWIVFRQYSYTGNGVRWYLSWDFDKQYPSPNRQLGLSVKLVE